MRSSEAGRPLREARRSLPLVIAFALLVGALTGLVGARPARAATPAQTVAEAMQPGWNLGNSFDAIGADETAWGNPVVTRALIAKVKSEGFNSIRIPVTWGQHEGAAPDYTIDAAFLTRVEQVVDWALAENLYVMLDVHHDSWQWVTNMPSQKAAVLAQFNATWKQLAERFKNKSDKLLLESINEQSFTGASDDAQSYALLAELNASFHSIVRASGGGNATRYLVLPTLYDNGEQARLDALAAELTKLNDPRIITTVHYYGYWPFSANVAGTTSFDANTQKDLTDSLDRAYNTFVAKGIPVIIGEYGLLGFDKDTGAIEQGEKLKYFEFFGYYARSKNLTTMLWDNGQHLDRTALTWKDPDLIAHVKSSWTRRSGTASTDLLFVRKATGAASTTVTLNPNGTTFTSLSQGSTRLVAGTDYTLSGDKLTFPAATLTRLSGNQAYGTNATLTATFNQGVPWKFNVVTYDTPALSNATGTTTSFVIPAAFKGDQLATMEAAYSDGSGAGPQNWTTYKEYGTGYQPSYSANTITLPSTFFAEVRDGAVKLTFHFRSGTTVTYNLVKAGSSVSGTVGTVVTPATPTPDPTTPAPTTPAPTTPAPTTPAATTPAATTPAATTPAPTTPAPTGGCTAALTVSSSWGGGFAASVEVKATSALKGWKVAMTLPSGTSVASLWNGVASGTSGTVNVTNAAYNGSVPAGGTQSFGFIGNGTGTGTTVSCTAL